MIDIFILAFVTPLVNFTVMLMALSSRWKLRVTLPLFLATEMLIGFPLRSLFVYLGIAESFQRLIGAACFLPVLLLLVKGQLFQKIFAYFMQLVLSTFLRKLVIAIYEFIFPQGGDYYNLFMIVAMFISYAAYILLVGIYGKKFLKKLFIRGKTARWGLYSIGAMLSFMVMIVSEFYIVQKPAFFLVLFFAVWSFVILCFAIVNTHEKAIKEYEADRAREIISSGRDYYEKMTDMTEQLHILRHDHKHHLAAMQKMVDDGYNAEAREYLVKLYESTDDDTVHNYCNNRVLNSLLDNFAERCKKENIEFSVKITLPENLTVNDYELCIIVGNLFENAITACQRTPEGKKRYIEFSMKPFESQYGIMTINSYDGVVKYEGKELFSAKKDSSNQMPGIGINSIKSVAGQHNGEYIPVWDNEKFTAIVVLKTGNQ